MKYKKMKKYRKQQKFCYNNMLFFGVIAVLGFILMQNENISALWINLIGLAMLGGGGFICSRLMQAWSSLGEVLKNDKLR